MEDFLFGISCTTRSHELQLLSPWGMCYVALVWLGVRQERSGHCSVLQGAHFAFLLLSPPCLFPVEFVRLDSRLMVAVTSYAWTLDLLFVRFHSGFFSPLSPGVCRHRDIGTHGWGSRMKKCATAEPLYPSLFFSFCVYFCYVDVPRMRTFHSSADEICIGPRRTEPKGRWNRNVSMPLH